MNGGKTKGAILMVAIILISSGLQLIQGGLETDTVEELVIGVACLFSGVIFIFFREVIKDIMRRAEITDEELLEFFAKHGHHIVKFAKSFEKEEEK